ADDKYLRPIGVRIPPFPKSVGISLEIDPVAGAPLIRCGESLGYIPRRCPAQLFVWSIEQRDLRRRRPQVQFRGGQSCRDEPDIDGNDEKPCRSARAHGNLGRSQSGILQMTPETGLNPRTGQWIEYGISKPYAHDQRTWI